MSIKIYNLLYATLQHIKNCISAFLNPGTRQALKQTDKDQAAGVELPIKFMWFACDSCTLEPIIK